LPARNQIILSRPVGQAEAGCPGWRFFFPSALPFQMMCSHPKLRRYHHYPQPVHFITSYFPTIRCYPNTAYSIFARKLMYLIYSHTGLVTVIHEPWAVFPQNGIWPLIAILRTYIYGVLRDVSLRIQCFN
jgi:hypothetical protein